MEIILSRNCLCLAGALGQGYGYFIQRRMSQVTGKVTFHSVRSKHPPIPSDGHLRFLFLCAEMAQQGMYIRDVALTREELADALREAGCTTPLYGLTKYSEDYPAVFNARQVMNFKERYQLS